jgi:hypothetical protein
MIIQFIITQLRGTAPGSTLDRKRTEKRKGRNKERRNYNKAEESLSVIYLT